MNIPVSIRDYVSSLGYDARADIPITTSEHNLFAKGTYLVSQNHTANATYMYDHRDLTNQQTGGNSAGDHGYDDKRRAWFLVGNLTSVLRSNLVNELRLSASHQALDRVLPAGSTSRPEIRFPTVQFGRASNVPQGRSQDNYIVTNATSVNYVAKGTHDLKFGFEANIVPTTSTINQSFNGLFEFLQDRPVVAGDPTSLPFRFTQGVELRGELAALTRDVNIYSAFVNNQWRPANNLTINLGLRYDWQLWRGDLNGQDIPDDVPIEEFWVRQITGDLRGQNFKPVPNDMNNLAPRLGVTWDPGSDGRTVVRAGYGIYYDQINTTTMRGVVAGYPGFITTQIANDARSGLQIPNDFFPNLPTRTFPESAGTAFNVASDSAESPYTHQMTAGATHQLGTNYAVSFDYVYMRGDSFPITRNVNARQDNNLFPLILSGTRLLLYADEAKMRIHQAQFRLQKRFASRLGFLVGYTLGSAMTVANGGTPSNHYDLDFDWGPTANDVRHRFVTNVIYELPWQFQAGLIVTANSAPPYNITLGTDANRDGDNFDRPEGVEYNEGRGDSFFQTDLRLSKKVTFGRFTGEVLWEMFNLFNTVNFNNYNGNMSSAQGVTATGRPTGFGQPRQAFESVPGAAGVQAARSRTAAQGTGNREQGTGNREQGTGNREQGTRQGTGERRAREQGTGEIAARCLANSSQHAAERGRDKPLPVPAPRSPFPGLACAGPHVVERRTRRSAYPLPMDGFLQDVRLATRALWKSPLATGLAMVCLALGIGTNATMFSVVSGLLLNPLPFPEPGQLSVVSATRPESGARSGVLVRGPGGLPGPGRRLRRAGRGAGTQPDLFGHRRARARARRGGQLAPVLDAGHRPGARPRFHCRRRSAGSRQRRDAQRRAVAAPLQRRPRDRRPARSP